MKKTIILSAFSAIFLITGIAFGQTAKSKMTRNKKKAPVAASSTVTPAPKTTTTQEKADTAKPKTGGTRMAISNKGIPTKGHSANTAKPAAATGDGKKTTPTEGAK